MQHITTKNYECTAHMIYFGDLIKCFNALLKYKVMTKVMVIFKIYFAKYYHLTYR